MVTANSNASTLQRIANDWAAGQVFAAKLSRNSPQEVRGLEIESSQVEECSEITADAAAQADSMRRYMDMRRQNPDKCPSYGCDAVLGPDSGIIDGDRYCADCCANEAEVAGREERLRDAELLARGGGNL